MRRRRWAASVGAWPWPEGVRGEKGDGRRRKQAFKAMCAPRGELPHLPPHDGCLLFFCCRGPPDRQQAGAEGTRQRGSPGNRDGGARTSTSTSSAATGAASGALLPSSVDPAHGPAAASCQRRVHVSR